MSMLSGRTRRPLWTAALVVCGLLICNVASAEWFKGNTHCHTSASSDSSTPIEDLMSWYKANDYHFIVVTDHNRYTTQAALDALRDDRGRTITDDSFFIIPGEELTTSAHHINGIDLPNRLDPASTIEANFELVWANGALPQLNHPEWNFLRARDIIEEISELDGPMFMEIFNSHPSVIDRSGPSSEDVWDTILATGSLMWGVAVDDAHTLVGGDKPPGGGYIYVEADSLNKDDIIDAMARGRFYASSGATLADFGNTRSLYDVDAPGATEIVFIGEDGVILERVRGQFASYRFRGDELYVRARIESPEGFAWTQPVFLDNLPPNDGPIALIEASETRGQAPLAVQFDGRGSSDPDGEVVTLRWDFGDGATGRGEVILHNYELPGTYTVELTVFDDQGEPGRETLQIVVLDDQGDPGPVVTPEPDPSADPDVVGQPDMNPEPEGDDPTPIPTGQVRAEEGCSVGNSKTPASPIGAPLLIFGLVWWAAGRRRSV